MKKLAALLTAITLVATTVVFAAPVNYGAELTNQPTKSYSQTFKDVPKSYWAFSYISEMVSRGVLSGYPDGYFYPENNITRAEFAKIMTCAAGLTIDEKAGTNYDDVIWDDWSVPYIEAAKYYLSGYTTPDGSIYYFPDDLALREDIAVALVKLKGYSTIGYDLSILQAMFTDWQSISEGARKYVSVAIDQGLISGYDDRTFRGQQGITRAEAATLLWRAYQYGNGNKSFELVPEVIEKPTKDDVKEEVKKPTKETTKDTDTDDEVTKTETKQEETKQQEETKKDYTWNLKTIKSSGLGNVDIFQAVPGGVSFKDGQKIYKVSDNGKQSVIYDADEQEYLGNAEVSSRDNTTYRLLTYAYNYYDDCYYALIEDNHDGIYRMHNITNGNDIAIENNDGIRYCSGNSENDYYTPDITFTKNGECFFICPTATIYSSGQTKCVNYGPDSYISVSNGKKCYLYNIGDLCLSNNNGIGTIEKDEFIDRWEVPIPFDGKFYGWDDGSIFTLDTEGNVKTFANLSMDNIQNDEERDLDFSEVFRCGSMNDNHDIYFFDTRFGAIRVLEYLK